MHLWEGFRASDSQGRAQKKKLQTPAPRDTSRHVGWGWARAQAMQRAWVECLALPPWNGGIPASPPPPLPQECAKQVSE